MGRTEANRDMGKTIPRVYPPQQDVYKRQPSPFLFFQSGRLKIRIAVRTTWMIPIYRYPALQPLPEVSAYPIRYGPAAAPTPHIQSVSYTHLDVYKRQIIRFRVPRDATRLPADSAMLQRLQSLPTTIRRATPVSYTHLLQRRARLCSRILRA